jgi:hypothetical protein
LQRIGSQLNIVDVRCSSARIAPLGEGWKAEVWIFATEPYERLLCTLNTEPSIAQLAGLPPRKERRPGSETVLNIRHWAAQFAPAKEIPAVADQSALPLRIDHTCPVVIALQIRHQSAESHL